jgi:hypothetical protein
LGTDGGDAGKEIEADRRSGTGACSVLSVRPALALDGRVRYRELPGDAFGVRPAATGRCARPRLEDGPALLRVLLE